MSDRRKDEVEKLRCELRRLEAQVAVLSNSGCKKTIKDTELLETPYEATGKLNRCKNCSSMRMPHRSNPHYTCTIRRSTIEPNWTCGRYRNNTQ
jgi:ribosomal protein L32